MTEAWKSHKMHWCDVCRCWLNDTKAAIAHHEAGMGHKANLQRKLREMGKKADEEKRKTQETAAALKKIESEAATKFKADQEAAQKSQEVEAAAAEARNGRWVWDKSCSYYYNERHRWYYDPKSKWYFGGEPVAEWKQLAPIPAAALFGTAPHQGGPVPQPAAAAKPSPAASGAGGARPAGAASKQVVSIALPSHPQALIGGHQAHHVAVGHVGQAKGITSTGAPGGGVATPKPTAGEGKRKRDDDANLSKEELEFRAKREAARQRVAQRTAQNFGFL